VQERTGTVIVYDEMPVVKAASRFVKSTMVFEERAGEDVARKYLFVGKR